MENNNQQEEQITIVPDDEPMEGSEEELPYRLWGKRVLVVEPDMKKFECYENMLKCRLLKE